MLVRPIVYTYSYEEKVARSNILQFLRGPERITWELQAEKLLVYLFSDIVQIVGPWSEQESANVVKGVLNIKLSGMDMEKARSRTLTATEISKLPWEDWFIYRIDKGDEWRGEHSLNYNEAR